MAADDRKNDQYSEGRLMTLINTVGNSLLLGILFLLCSIPVVTFGTSLSAFYYAMIKTVRRERGYPVREFFSAFKRNVLKGIIFTVLLAAIGYLLLLNRTIYITKDDPDGSAHAALWVTVYDILLIVWAAFTVWIFPVISRFKLAFKKTVSLTFTIAGRYCYFTVLLIAGWALTVYLCLKLSVGFTLIVPPLACYGSTYIIERAFKRFIPKPSEREDGWYYDGE